MIALLVIALLAQSPGGDPTRPTPGSGFFHGFDPSYDPPEDVQADLVKGRDAYYQMTPGKDGKVTEPTQVLRYNLVPSRDEVPQTFTLPSGKTWNVWRHARFGSSATRACYWYLGLEMMYRASSMIAGMTTNFRQASDFRNLAERVKLTRGNRCDGPDGTTARGFLNEVVRGWQAQLDVQKYHRQAQDSTQSTCIPAPFPGVTACAPTRDEVYRPKDETEWLVLATVIAVLTPLPGDEAAALAALTRLGPPLRLVFP